MSVGKKGWRMVSVIDVEIGSFESLAGDVELE